jgi:hypothetical protein
MMRSPQRRILIELDEHHAKVLLAALAELGTNISRNRRVVRGRALQAELRATENVIAVLVGRLMDEL